MNTWPTTEASSSNRSSVTPSSVSLARTASLSSRPHNSKTPHWTPAWQCSPQPHKLNISKCHLQTSPLCVLKNERWTQVTAPWHLWSLPSTGITKSSFFFQMRYKLTCTWAITLSPAGFISKMSSESTSFLSFSYCHCLRWKAPLHLLSSDCSISCFLKAHLISPQILGD